MSVKAPFPCPCPCKLPFFLPFLHPILPPAPFWPPSPTCLLLPITPHHCGQRADPGFGEGIPLPLFRSPPGPLRPIPLPPGPFTASPLTPDPSLLAPPLLYAQPDPFSPSPPPPPSSAPPPLPVCCCHKGDTTEVEGQAQVCVGEGVVLFRVKHLQQSSSRITPDAWATAGR